jgi:hypothetical protein
MPAGSISLWATRDLPALADKLILARELLENQGDLDHAGPKSDTSFLESKCMFIAFWLC